MFDEKRRQLLSALTENYYYCNDNCPTYIIPDCKPSEIDLMFSKLKYRIMSFNHFSSYGISNHQSLIIQYNLLPNKKTKSLLSFRNYNIQNTDQLLYEASLMD